jgi:MurNAc alpha-1-phosphate uridylyltransferase
MKAMILAAGRGERLRPFTDSTPKALLPYKGLPLIAHHLINLSAAGITEIVINISYLAREIMEALQDGKKFGVTIQYSFEPDMLETGGGIFQALSLLDNKPFIAIAADIFTNYDFQNLEKKLTRQAHLVMVDNPYFHPKGDFVLRDGIIYDEENPRLTFGSIGIYHPDLFQHCNPGKFRLTDVLLPAIARKEMTGEHFHGVWENITNYDQYEKLMKHGNA